MIKPILLGLAALVFVLSGATYLSVSHEPDHYAVEQNLRIEKPLDDVFEFVNQINLWEKWNPWKFHDPEMLITLGPVSSGRGASLRWDGKIAGKAEVTLLEIIPRQRIKVDLHFLSPQDGHLSTQFLFVSQGPATLVYWIINGDNHGFKEKFFYKINHHRENLSQELSLGLAQLKAVVESKPIDHSK